MHVYSTNYFYYYCCKPILSKFDTYSSKLQNIIIIDTNEQYGMMV